MRDAFEETLSVLEARLERLARLVMAAPDEAAMTLAVAEIGGRGGEGGRA